MIAATAMITGPTASDRTSPGAHARPGVNTSSGTDTGLFGMRTSDSHGSSAEVTTPINTSPASSMPGDSATRELVVLTWGGAYEASQRAAYFEPFTRETGIPIRTARYDGGLAAMRPGDDGSAPAWDVVDLVAADAEAACREGLLEPFDPDSLVAVGGVMPYDDFDPGSFMDCAVAQVSFSTVIAYDVRAFPGVKPSRIRDFFDVERFPGKRALRCAPVAILEWALLAYDVPRQQIYDLLSTSRGLDLAFRQLDRLRAHLVWWHGGDEPARLLREGKVVMASGYNGRFFDAEVLRNAPISVIWDGQLLDRAAWAIREDTPREDIATRFIRFATRPDRMAAQAMRISYGPTRASARARVGRHVAADIDMAAHLPTHPAHRHLAVVEDSEWYARTDALRERRFADWLAAAELPSCQSAVE